MSPKPAGPFPGLDTAAHAALRIPARPEAGRGRLRWGTGIIPIESGCHLRCYPAVCTDPETGHTYWCTECFTECIEVPE